MADILLIHGTWTGGWMWKPLKDRLIARGHNVIAPTLTGLGEREHLLTPAVGLDTHIRDLEAVIHWEMLNDIVAVAHSYGGMLISALADRLPGKVAAAAFINAALPKDGEAMLDYQTPERVREVMALVEEEGDGYRVPRRLLLKTGLTDPVAEAAFLARTSDHPLKCLTTQLAVGDGLANVDRKLHLVSEHTRQRFAADHDWAKSQIGWQTVELGITHFPMLTDPDRTAELVESLARPV
jgi:pimeloyl-ACP methyl ester carboxylesterase